MTCRACLGMPERTIFETKVFPGRLLDIPITRSKRQTTRLLAEEVRRLDGDARRVHPLQILLFCQDFHEASISTKSQKGRVIILFVGSFA